MLKFNLGCYACPEHIFEDLINPFRLTIGLRVVSRTANELSTKGCVKVLPKMCNKLCSTVRNDSPGYSMQTQDTADIQLVIMLCPIDSFHRKKMS